MIKKIISLLLVFVMILVIAIPTDVLGADKNYARQRLGGIKQTQLYNGNSSEQSSDSFKSELLVIKAVQNLITKIETIILNTESSNATVKYKTIKILSIGNSFSQDATQYLYDIAQSAGVTVIVGNLYNSGCSLERHWTNAKYNTPGYTYYKWTSSGMNTTEKQTIKAAVLDEDWDFITFQQDSGDSGNYATYQPYLNNLISYVKKLAPHGKLALNMTWAYASDSTHKSFVNYRSNQKCMYYEIVDAYKQAINETGINIIVPCGTAIQNARTNPVLSEVGDELTLDGYHLNTGIGRYIAALTFFETLIVNNENFNKDLFTDVPFVPAANDSNEDLVNLAKIAVMNAVKYPYQITYESSRRKIINLFSVLSHHAYVPFGIRRFNKN